MEYQKLARLVDDYRPNKTVLERLGCLDLLLIVGPSGVGKSTLIKTSGIPAVIGDASRPPRDDEQDGVDYWFHSEAYMVGQAQAGQFVQIAAGSEGDIKATHTDSFPVDGSAIFAVVAAAVPTFRKLPFAKTMTAVIVPPDYGSWMERLGQHHTPADKLAPRLAEAKLSYEFALHDKETRFVLNDRIPAAVRRLHQVIGGGVPEASDRARQIAEELLRRVS